MQGSSSRAYVVEWMALDDPKFSMLSNCGFELNILTGSQRNRPGDNRYSQNDHYVHLELCSITAFDSNLRKYKKSIDTII